MARYIVENRAFNTGEWYIKTSTDRVASAFSVAQCQNWGRASRVIDTLTGEVLYEKDEEPGAAELASEYRKF